MIIDIRGTNGSGKSWVARQLFLAAEGVLVLRGPGITPESQGQRKPDAIWAYMLSYQPHFRDKLYVVGRYDGDHGGGCDPVSPLAEVEARVRYLAKFGHVVFEGVIVSGTFGRFGQVAAELPYTAVGLTTELDRCLDNIALRRRLQGKDPDAFNRTNPTRKAREVRSALRKFREAGTPTYETDADGAPALILNILERSERNDH